MGNPLGTNRHYVTDTKVTNNERSSWEKTEGNKYMENVK